MQRFKAFIALAALIYGAILFADYIDMKFGGEESVEAAEDESAD